MVAARKVGQLLKAGADVLVVAPEIAPELRELREAGSIRYRAEAFSESVLTGCVLVIAATDNADVNREISEAARRRGIPVNVVDNPALCSFIMPSVVDRDPVQIAVSTGGASPVLARLLRARLETLIPAAYGRLAQVMRDFRERARRRFPDMRQRRRFWEQVLQGPVAEMLFAGQDRAAMQALEKLLDEPDATVSAIGEVYLVGGGPGDPDLLTFRALRLMQQADVVLYDRLVAPAIVDLCRRDADRIYVGKEADRHALSQQDMNRLLIRLAREGKRVLRLKGGDPFMFGRGGEEIEELAAAGIPFQVVPGITAAAGCAAYAGIPLTHRDHAHSCLFVTAHLKDGRIDLNWQALVQPRQTIAVYMGVKGLDVLCRALVEHGMPPDLPAALIERGTTPQQRVLIGELQTLPQVAAAGEVQPPCLAVIGSVVSLHRKLAWYEPAGS
jgi:uroporphyrin-III C-methyltransferase/precorrin-2 dehydrogenase/sirohydrochlorin ferrochelatase